VQCGCARQIALCRQADLQSSDKATLVQELILRPSHVLTCSHLKESFHRPLLLFCVKGSYLFHQPGFLEQIRLNAKSLGTYQEKVTPWVFLLTLNSSKGMFRDHHGFPDF